MSWESINHLQAGQLASCRRGLAGGGSSRNCASRRPLGRHLALCLDGFVGGSRVVGLSKRTKYQKGALDPNQCLEITFATVPLLSSRSPALRSPTLFVTLVGRPMNQLWPTCWCTKTLHPLGGETLGARNKLTASASKDTPSAGPNGRPKRARRT